VTGIELVEFPATGYWYDVEAPLTGGSTNQLQFLVISAFVTFTARVPIGFTAQIANLDLGNGNTGSASLAIPPVTARVHDGQLSTINASDTPGVPLLANSAPIAAALAAINISELYYDVSFTDVVYAEENQTIDNFAFQASTGTTPICITDPTLTRYAYQTPSQNTGGLPAAPLTQSISINQVTGFGTAGLAVAESATTASIISLLGLGGGQDTYLGTSANQTAMLALTGPEGSWTIRTDTTPNTVWYLTGTPASSLGSWTELPAITVTSDMTAWIARHPGSHPVPKSRVTYYDKPNTAWASLPTTLDTGEPVTYSAGTGGAAAQVAITSGVLALPRGSSGASAEYTNLDAGAGNQLTRLGFSFQVDTSGTTDGWAYGAAMANGNGLLAGGTAYRIGVHMTISQTGWAFSKASNATGTLVNTFFTGGTGTFATPLVDGNEYSVEIWRNGTTMVAIMPDGTRVVCTDANISTWSGQYGYFEPTTTASNTDNLPGFKEVWFDANTTFLPSSGGIVTSDELAADLLSPEMSMIRGTLGGNVLQIADIASAVNYIGGSNRTAGSAPYFYAGGSDTNISPALIGKGTGKWGDGTSRFLTLNDAVDNADGTISVGSVKAMETLPVAAAVITANTAPAIGKTTYYNASGGSLYPPMPALSGLNAGARLALRRDPLDASQNTITFALAGSDTFYSSGSTSFTLPITGEQREYQVVQPGGSGTKYWAPAGDLNPVAGLDARYLTPMAKAKVVVTDNCLAQPNGTIITPGSSATQEFFYTVGVAAADLQLEFALYQTQMNGVESDTGTTVTMGAAVVDASGNVFAVSFGGVHQITISSGGRALSDPLPIDVAVGDVIRTRTYVVSGSSYYQTRRCLNVTNGGGSSASDLTATGAGAVTQANAFGFAPIAIIGTPTAPGTPKAVVLQGDSVMMGIYDGTTAIGPGYLPLTPWLSGGGWALRALSGHAGVLQIAMNGETLQNFLLNTAHFRRSAVIKYARYAICNYAINDIAAGRTAAQIQANLLTQANRNAARGIVKTIIQTVTPRTTSTDRFTTTTNQTLSTSTTNTVRIAHNTWVRDGGPIDPSTLAPVAAGTTGAVRFGAANHPIAGYLELADIVESSRNSGLWMASGRVVTDAVTTASSLNVTSATAAFTSADQGKDITIAGAGSAGADHNTQISSVTNSTTVVVTLAPVTTVSAATAVIAPITKDGLHPWTYGNAFIAAAIQSALLAFLN
jgi:hypothetical protein